jgi:hypothetical protein
LFAGISVPNQFLGPRAEVLFANPYALSRCGRRR